MANEKARRNYNVRRSIERRAEKAYRLKHPDQYEQPEKDMCSAEPVSSNAPNVRVAEHVILQWMRMA